MSKVFELTVRSEAGTPIKRASDRRRGRATRWTLAIMGALIGLGFSELALRLLSPVLPARFTSLALQELHPVYGVFHRPGASAWIHDPEFATFVRFNRDGLRGPDVPPTPTPGKPRVLVLGDSFVEGSEVDEDDTLTSVLARNMADAGRPIDVLNAGVRGWGTAQEYLYLSHQGLALHPDIVVLVLYVGNDLVDNSLELSALAPDGIGHRPFFTIEAGALALLPSSPPREYSIGPLLEMVRTHSILFNLLESGVAIKLTYADRAGVLRSVHRLVFADPPLPAWEQAWVVTEALITAVRDATEAQGGRFLLAVAPHKGQLDSDDWERLVRGEPPPAGSTWNPRLPQLRLADLANRHGLAMLDLLPALEVAQEAGALYFEQNSHWTAAGHRAVAGAIARVLAAGVDYAGEATA